MEILLETLFTSELAQFMLEDIDLSSIVPHVLDMEKKSKGTLKSNAGGYQSDVKFRNNYDYYLTGICFEEYIIPALDNIANQWGLPKAYNLSYWYNINRKFNYNHSHYHPGSALSGVLYLKVPENSGNLVFQRSFSDADRMDFLTEYQISSGEHFDDNPNTNVMCWRKPDPYRVFVFQGFQEHYVGQNLTDDCDDIRISISFNYFYK